MTIAIGNTKTRELRLSLGHRALPNARRVEAIRGDAVTGVLLMAGFLDRAFWVGEREVVPIDARSAPPVIG
jgi:hypothetical protein